VLLAAQFYERAAKRCHRDGANNFGICLEHGRGVEENIEMASEYYKFAADQGHSEAKLNFKRCLRLLDPWESPNRPSEIFSGFLKDPKPSDEDSRRLLSSFEQLKTPTKIPVISNSFKVNWIPIEIESGDSSVVKLTLDSKSGLIAAKTSKTPNHAEFIRWEVFIHKTFKHPLILKSQRDISESLDHNSVIVTEFAGNGSLVSHFPLSGISLSGAKMLTRVVVGIVLAMRFVH
jgi:hypothetical protein